MKEENVYPDPVWHVTAMEAADAIAIEGFSLEASPRLGRQWGNVVHFVTQEDSVDGYWELIMEDDDRLFGGVSTLTCVVNVRKLLEVPVGDGEGEAQTIEQIIEKLLPHRFASYLNDWPSDVNAGIVALEILAQEGYDGLLLKPTETAGPQISGEELVVFDPARIVVTHREDTPDVTQDEKIAEWERKTAEWDAEDDWRFLG